MVSTATGQRRAVFLDRDGVLNRAYLRDGKSYPPQTLSDFTLLDGVSEACERLKAAGFLLIVVTNQPDVATGKQAREVVEAMHDRLQSWLPLDEILTCFHVDADGCSCRKPQPGMLVEAARRHGIELAASYLVGDRWRDIEAGQAAGCHCYLIDYAYREQRPVPPFETTTSLIQAATQILSLQPRTTSLLGCST